MILKNLIDTLIPLLEYEHEMAGHMDENEDSCEICEKINDIKKKYNEYLASH